VKAVRIAWEISFIAWLKLGLSACRDKRRCLRAIQFAPSLRARRAAQGTSSKGYWLGFDREFFLGTVTSEQARLYEITINAQAAALDAIRPGAVAEDVHFAANDIYLSAGFPSTYRTGRGTGAAILDAPELEAGDKTKLQPGMTFAGDGGLSVAGRFGARVGDSIAVTAEEGFEYLTPYPKKLTVI